ncbi:phosphatase PAP2 family protein [Shewanella sp.]|uniref:phosphatase PAP2 family protein n=1 Tax=Shewanella sp. TaxID=50422 RepID=UPI003A980178
MRTDLPANQWLLLSWGLLLLPPLLLFSTGVSLFPWLDLSSSLANLNYAITMTGTRPWGIVTSAVVLLLIWRLIPAPQRGPMLLATLLALGLNLIVSHGLKNLFQESRPYVEYLANHGLLDLSQFYASDTAARSTLLHGLALEQLPQPLSSLVWQQWQFETGYSFPSGHTLFSCTLALCGCYALLPQQRFGWAFLLIAWAWWVSISRILLGMHWPADVLVSALLSGVIVWCSQVLIQRLLRRKVRN